MQDTLWVTGHKIGTTCLVRVGMVSGQNREAMVPEDVRESGVRANTDFTKRQAGGFWKESVEYFHSCSLSHDTPTLKRSPWTESVWTLKPKLGLSPK